jgi:SAM-dependent methyltransferase
MADLGSSPLANELGGDEERFPLVAYVCEECLLVQVPAVVPAERIFGGDYVYFSSFSDSWLAHTEQFAATAVERFGLDASSLVVEVGSNDGHLLRAFAGRGIAVLGIDAAPNAGEAARAAGVDTVTAFLDAQLAASLRARGTRADLLVANNVLPHVPDLHDFVEGLHSLLADDGVLAVEVPHLLRLVRDGLFDTIYHEHYSYFSLRTAAHVLGDHGLVVVDVERLPTHGGSLRIYARRDGAPNEAVAEVLADEESLEDLDTYDRFAARVEGVRVAVRAYLEAARAEGRRVAGYGAPAKATTLLNVCGVGPDLLPYTVDRSPLKQGRTVPGTGVPIFPPERLGEDRPDEILLLPWNLRDELVEQLAGVREWGCRLVVPGDPVEVIA